MSTGLKRKFFWLVLILALIGSWLPYFNILNQLVWIGPLSLPLAWVLTCNVVLTLCAIALYPIYFKPLSERVDELEREGEGNE
ncbi:hypothetical protein [Halomonas sp. AOP43-D1-4]|uniref:hypothetical protein n=1 Tax=Halomonas sp. AOP43-D1-4 TaxID=3457658 RepID=UPI004034938D